MSLGTNIWNIETISALSLFHSWKRHMFSLCPCLEILFPWHLSSFLSFTAYSILSTLKKKELIKYLFYKAFWFYPPTSFSTFNNVDVAWWNLPSSFHIILLLLFFILTSHLFVNVTYLLCSYSKLATMTRTTVNMSTRQTGLLASQSFTFSAGGKQTKNIRVEDSCSVCNYSTLWMSWKKIKHSSKFRWWDFSLQISLFL